MAVTLTPSGLQYVQGTDVESAFPAIDQANKTILNNATFFKSGTLASRPTASSSTNLGSLYYATDTGALYLNETGSTWSLVGPFQLTPATISSNTTAVQGTLYYTSTALTLTLPSASGLPAIPIGVAATYAASASSPVTLTVGTGAFAGVGLAATSFTLGVPSASVILMPAGAAWQIISGQADTGWVPLTLGSGVGNQAGYAIPSVRQVGDVVRLKGTVASSSGVAPGTTIASIPAGISDPPVDFEWTSWDHVNGVNPVTLNTSGVLTSAVTLRRSSLDGMSYSLS